MPLSFWGRRGSGRKTRKGGTVCRAPEGPCGALPPKPQTSPVAQAEMSLANGLQLLLKGVPWPGQLMRDLSALESRSPGTPARSSSGGPRAVFAEHARHP